MLNINLNSLSSDMVAAMKELQKNIGFVISDQGIPVKIATIDQGFTVNRDHGGILLQYSTLNTLYRGILLMTANENLENYNIHQECYFQDFGILVDLSRNAVLNMDTLKDLIRHLALLGYQSLQLYTEDTLVIEEEEYFGYMRGALKGEEIQELDRYSKSFGIELIPCIQCLAHLQQIQRYERYEKMIDTQDILLVGEERTYELLEHILQTIAHNFSSRQINIGMDEAHMIGLGKYLDRHGYENRFEIMLKHLDRVKLLCIKYGFEPRMWSDMFFRLIYGGDYYNNKDTSHSGEIFSKIPKDIKLIYWDYYSCDYNRYADNLAKHLNITDNVGFAGGAWKWTGFAPDNNFSIKTGEAAVKACRDNHINSFVLTCWGDNGAEASIYSILPSIYFYAESVYTDRMNKECFQTLTGMAFHDFMLMDLPNGLVKKEQEHNNASKFFLYNDLLIGTFDSLASPQLRNMYETYTEMLKQIVSAAGRYGYLFETMQQLCSVLAIKVNLGNEMKEAYDDKNLNQLRYIEEVVLPELLKRYEALYQSFCKQWHKENKSFGFEVQCIRFGGLKIRAQYVMGQLSNYIEGRIAKIEELEEVRKPFAYFENNNPGTLNYNLWSDTVSPGVI